MTPFDPSAFLDALADDPPLPADARALERDLDLIDEAHAAESALNLELLVDKATGRVRQAGADTAEGRWVLGLKERCEQSLYAFGKIIFKRRYLTRALHAPVCAWLESIPPRRKGLLLPREHAKSSIVSHILPLHILIQSKETNPYFPGEDGAEQRIVLCCEKEGRGKDHLRVQQAAWMTNDLLRAFWPHRCWTNPRAQSKKWNDAEYIIPRDNEWPDPSVRAIGVDGAITGAHPSVLIKDDLISVAAANSDVEMQNAIQWHVTSRALINDPRCLEFIIGTRWAVHDLYSYIQREDPTVEWLCRSVVENGQPIYPEIFTEAVIEEKRAQFGSLFMLLYMNSANDPSLADFDLAQLRPYTIEGDDLLFDEDGRDVALRARTNALPPSTHGKADLRGTRLTSEVYDVLRARAEHLMFRRA